MTNPFSWDYLTAPIRNMETFGPLSIAFVIVFGVAFLAALFVSMRIDHFFAGDRILRKAVNRLAQSIVWITGVGLFFFSFRLMRVEFLTLYMRIWSYLFALALIAAIAYFVYWYQTSYREQIAEIARHRERQKYMPRAKAPQRRPRMKGKRGVR